MKNQLQKLLSKKEFLYTCVGLGFLTILLTAPWLQTSSLVVGVHTISIVLFLFINVAIAWLVSHNEPLQKNHILLLLVIFLITATPFIPYIGSEIEFNEKNDVWRYYTYAQNMLESGTLWGGDALLYEGQRHYVDQPGYRYLMAASLMLTSGPTRGLQLFHIFLYWTAVIWFLYALSRTKTLHSSQKNLVILFVLLSVAFAVKAILLGISEWFAAALSMIGFALIIRKSYWVAIVVFSLIPFFRQNLLISVILLVGWIIFIHLTTNRQKLIYGLSALIILLLPVWHNLYFANDFRLLVTNTAVPIEFTTENIKAIITRILQRFAHYAGITFESSSYSSMVLGLMIAPLGSFLVVYFATSISRLERLFYISLILCTVTPTLILGWAYYPRFEYLNLWFLISAGLILLNKKQHFELSTVHQNKLSQ